MVEFRINLTVSCIQDFIWDHLKVLFWNMTDEMFYEVYNRESLLDIQVILVRVIVESNGISVMLINPGCDNNGSDKIAADVFGDYFWITKIRFGIDNRSRVRAGCNSSLLFFKEGLILLFSSFSRAVWKALRR